ncbi:hypothetical protein MMC28_011558 [Mycoblastus sanguinarius]|nr:hypothetical protein [Mycoblastus sanguinarius]
MGGNAFANGPTPLSTPRMPPELYYSLRDYYLDLLLTFYAQAATPIEAPSKTSFGDIDTVVSQPKSRTISAESLAEGLAAKRTFTTPGSPTTSFALPYPDLPDNYVQLDVHFCPPSTFKWEIFHQSHGDLWNLLGTTIRPFGLTANNIGLHLRIAEIEGLNRKRGLLLLTSEPDKVLDFLGLGKGAYERPFESVETMYRYVCGCRFFRVETYMQSDLKANDRKRMAQRELYRRFVEEWLPKYREWIRTQGGVNADFARGDVLEEVISRFGKRKEHEERLDEWRKERKELLAKQEGRQKRKADAAELEEYANAWIRWTKHDVPNGSNAG